MRFKISPTKIIFFELILIIALIICLTICAFLMKSMHIKNNSFRIDASTAIDDESTKVVKLLPDGNESDNFVTMYLNDSNEIFGVDYVKKDFTVTHRIQDNEWLYSNVICPDFDEESYIMPFAPGEIPDMQLENIVVSNAFRYKSDKPIQFVLNTDGEGSILE